MHRRVVVQLSPQHTSVDAGNVEMAAPWLDLLPRSDAGSVFLELDHADGGWMGYDDEVEQREGQEGRGLEGLVGERILCRVDGHRLRIGSTMVDEPCVCRTDEWNGGDHCDNLLGYLFLFFSSFLFSTSIFFSFLHFSFLFFFLFFSFFTPLYGVFLFLVYILGILFCR